MTAYRLFPSTNGPASPVSFSGDFIAGVVFCVTAEAWFQGYWWWVCPSGQSTSATKFALWQIPNNGGVGGALQLMPGSVVTSGTLTAGQWNYVPLATPLALSAGGSPGMTPPISSPGSAVYCACVGVNGNFPDTNNSFGSGDPYVNGITSGPLTAYSALTGTMPCPGEYNFDQGVFTTGGSDPSVTPPGGLGDSTHDNFWIDIQVSDYSGAPAGASLRLWPGFPLADVAPNGDNTKAVSATAFTLSQACSLGKIWMFNPPGSTGLPSRCGIWNTGTQAIVPGTDSGTSPAWKVAGGGAASAGAGWIYVDYSGAGVTLPAGNYATSFYDSAGVLFYNDNHNYWFAGTDPKGGGTVGGPGWNGLSAGGGILTAPNVANGPELVYDDSSGTFPGQCMYRPGPASWAYPGEFEATPDWGESRWADVEVTPLAPAPPFVPTVAYSMRLS